jgi:putative membrane protein
MKKLFLTTLCLLALAACHHETTTSTSDTTDTSMTGVTMTDTSTTTSTTTPATMSGSVSPLSESDKTFAMKAAEGGMAEVTLGGVAAQRASNGDVKNFGNQMVTDHGKAGDQLKNWATTKGIALPAELNEEHKKLSDDLAKLTGSAFDKKYMDEMVKDHEKDVAEFKEAQGKVTDPDLKTWIDSTLPVIEGHLKMAQNIKSKLK